MLGEETNMSTYELFENSSCSIPVVYRLARASSIYGPHKMKLSRVENYDKNVIALKQDSGKMALFMIYR